MDYLYAPWRSSYTESSERSKQDDTTSAECAFCTQLHSNNDQENYILKRFANCAVLFNRYPYNAAHLLIVPFDHIGHIEHLSAQTRAELMEVANISTKILTQAARPDGFNIGFNMGKAAGGSIPTHLHLHVLPRWLGDTNFLPTLSTTKVISFDLPKIYQDLKPRFDAVSL